MLSLLSSTFVPHISRSTIKAYLKVNDNVLCRNFSEGDKWVPGKIIKQLGSMMFLIDIGNKIWKRHKNQIRINKTLNNSSFENTSQLALSLIESFTHQPIEGNFQSDAPVHQESPDTSLNEIPLYLNKTPPRRSTRLKRKPVRFTPPVPYNKLTRRN